MARNKEEKRRRVTPDQMRQNAAMSGGGRNILKLPKGIEEWQGPDKAGTFNIDFLPYEVTCENHPDRVEKGMIWWKFPFFAYQGIGVNQEWIVSPASVGLPCPITEHRNKLAADWDKNEAQIKALAQKKFVLYAIKDPKDKDRVALFYYSQFKLGDALDEEIKNAKEENLNFYDVVDGKTLAIRFSEEKYEGRGYLKASRVDFLDRKDMDEAETLAAVPPLEKCLNILPYDTIKAIFLGVGEDGGNAGGGEESQPARKTTGSGKGSGKSSAATPQPADEPEEDEDEKAPVFEVGDWVAGKNDQGEPVAGEVITVSSDGTDIEVKDVNGDTYDCLAEDLERREKPKPKAKETKAEPATKKGKEKAPAKASTDVCENAAGVKFRVGDTVEDSEGTQGVITSVDPGNEDAVIKPKKGAEITLDWDDIKKVIGGGKAAAEEPEEDDEEDEEDDDAYVPAVGDEVEWEDGEGEILKLRDSDGKAKIKTADGAVWVEIAKLSEKD